MLIDEWPIYAAINRREFRDAELERNRRYRAALDVMTVADKWVDRVTRAIDMIEFAGNGTTRRESMRDEYTRVAGTFGSIGQGDVGAKSARDPTYLEIQIKQIYSRICEIEGRQQVIDGAISRLVDPRPTPPSTQERIAAIERGNPSRDTIESSLRSIVERLDQLYANAERQADALNSAV